MGVERYNNSCLEHTRFEMLVSHPRISQAGIRYSSGIQELGL